MPIPRFNLADTALLVVDLQPNLLKIIDGGDAVVERAEVLVRGAAALEMPIFITEQYPERMGGTIDAIADALPPETARHAKLKFSACVAEVRQALAASGRRRVILAGIETHVCILQTALDLAEAGYIVGVAEDAVGSRRASDREAALARLRQCGIVPLSVEMALLELVEEAGTSRFKSVLPLIK